MFSSHSSFSLSFTISLSKAYFSKCPVWFFLPIDVILSILHHTLFTVCSLWNACAKQPIKISGPTDLRLLLLKLYCQFTFDWNRHILSSHVFETLCDLYLQQKGALRIVADFHRLHSYFVDTDILSRSFKLLKLPYLAHYFNYILGLRIFQGISLDFIRASFDEAEYGFCFRNRFYLHTYKTSIESLISRTFNTLPSKLKSLASFTIFFKSLLYNYIRS